MILKQFFFIRSFEHSYDYSGYTMREVLTVRIGWTRMLDEQIISVRRYVVESYHNPSTFALLELSTALKFTDKIQPIKLEDSNRKMANGDIALTSGLGMYSIYRFDYFNNLFQMSYLFNNYIFIFRG